MPNPTRAVWIRLGADGQRELRRLAARWRCHPAALLAVVEVESNGHVFAAVNGRREPLIRFEGHYFHRRIGDEALERAERAGLAHPTPQAVPNPPDQPARWAMLARAEAIDRRAARESCSWGLGQVMGAHWRRLGYACVDALVDEARRGADGQLALMARFIEDAGLEEALRGGDWHRFARAYNGANYARWGYHLKMEAAFERGCGLDLAAPPRAAPGRRSPFGPAGWGVALVGWLLNRLRR